MKKLLLAGLLIGMTGLAHATWYEKNPDHCASIGLNLDGASGSGKQTVKASGVSADQNFKSADLRLFADTRIPLSDALSLNAGVGFSGSGMTIDETNMLSGGELSGGSIDFNLGIRFYLH